MLHVNALNRNINVLVLEGNSFNQNLVLSQDTDENIVALRRKLEKNDDRLFEMRNDLVYRKANERILCSRRYGR